MIDRYRPEVDACIRLLPTRSRQVALLSRHLGLQGSTCSKRVDIAVFVGKECCIMLFKQLKRLNSFFGRCHAAVQSYYAAVIAV